MSLSAKVQLVWKMYDQNMLAYNQGSTVVVDFTWIVYPAYSQYMYNEATNPTKQIKRTGIIPTFY